MHPLHEKGTFLVPRRDDAPDVGVHAGSYIESIQDEVAEIAARYALYFPDALENPHHLIRYGMAVVGMIERRALADVEDFARPVAAAPKAELDAEVKRKVVSAELGRVLDWICKGRRVLDMGVRVAAVAGHIRSVAIDHRTDQQLAREMGNGSRESISKVRKEFRLDVGANYPGEHGKSTNTKTRCKNSRLRNLKN